MVLFRTEPLLDLAESNRNGNSLFTENEMNAFIDLAESEGWISDAWELKFLQQSFPTGCMVCMAESTPIAFVTSIKYELSGWIGNLLVRNEWRRQGIGSALFTRALELLDQSGVQTIWLTASEAGKPLYENHGFIAIDTIQRWEGYGRFSNSESVVDLEKLIGIDQAGWGDRRESLMSAMANRGSVWSFPGGFMILQNWPSGLQIGPWGCNDGRTAAVLLQQAFIPADNGIRVFLDAPVRNRAAYRLLQSKGFAVQSSATLMYRGKAPDYDPEKIFALASMGSMG